MPGDNSSAAKRARVPQRSLEPPRFMVIEGPLRVGKTTLARILAERLHARRIYDCEDNPFLRERRSRAWLCKSRREKDCPRNRICDGRGGVRRGCGRGGVCRSGEGLQ